MSLVEVYEYLYIQSFRLLPLSQISSLYNVQVQLEASFFNDEETLPVDRWPFLGHLYRKRSYLGMQTFATTVIL